jgi:hypothetical protein
MALLYAFGSGGIKAFKFHLADLKVSKLTRTT